MTHSVDVDVLLKDFPHMGLMTHMKLKKMNCLLKQSDR